jgi:hypothetical protein
MATIDERTIEEIEETGVVSGEEDTTEKEGE